MSRTLPPKEQQIVMMHGSLITNVVHAVEHPALQEELKRNLEVARDKGWGDLMNIILKILAGDRSENLLKGVDDEDKVIVRAILMGIQNPDTLPKIDEKADGTIAAPGLAAMIQAAASGDAQALVALGGMAEQMSGVGGEMARIGTLFKKMIDGERDPEVLTKGMGDQSEKLTLAILAELDKSPIIH
jgi:hypothetical protein